MCIRDRSRNVLRRARSRHAGADRDTQRRLRPGLRRAMRPQLVALRRRRAAAGDGAGPLLPTRLFASPVRPRIATGYATLDPITAGVLTVYPTTAADTCATRSDAPLATLDVPLAAPAGSAPSGRATLDADETLAIAITGWAGPPAATRPIMVLPFHEGP